MRNKETYFEQVPIEVVEAILDRDAARERALEKSHSAAPALRGQAVKEPGKQVASTWSKGPQ
jgi:hypothetical protein